MLDELTNEIKAQLYDRVKSPLFGAFAFSWIAWNYRVLLMLLSGNDFTEKTAFVDKTYPTAWDVFLHCGLGPLLTAVLFLLVYPFPARWVYSYWANQQKELKKVQQRIEDETPLTQEEANALRKTGLAQVQEFQQQLKGLTATNKELEAQIKTLQDDNVRLETERRQFETGLLAAEKQLTEARGAVMNSAQKHLQITSLREKLSTALMALSDDQQKEISRLFPVGHENERNIFMFVVASGGAAAISDVTRGLGLNPIDIKAAAENLADLDILTSAGSAGSLYLASDGQTLARRTGLTQALPSLPS